LDCAGAAEDHGVGVDAKREDVQRGEIIESAEDIDIRGWGRVFTPEPRLSSLLIPP